MSDLQRALDFLQKCISIEKDSVWRLSKSDPFAALLLDLESDENGILSFCNEPCCCDAQLAGTSGSLASQAQRDPTSVFFDVRIRYGRIIISALRKVAEELSILKHQEESSTVSILSLKHIALISSAFQFFILTCISPYLDKGVGVPLNLRSQIIRSWEMCAGDVGFKSEQLCRAGECITALLNCNSAVRSELLRKYCSDIICVFEQLKCYGPGDMLSQYEDMLAMVPLQLLVCSFLGLVKPRSSAAPTWFIDSIGSRLSAILLGEHGLHITLSAYEEISNGQFWDNTHLVTVLGKQLSLPPRTIKRMIYYKNISDQFFELLNSGKFSRKKVSLLFSLFCEQLKRINAFAWSIMIEDVLYKPWEVIASSSNFTWSSSHATSLFLLTLWSENRLSSQLLRESPRFLLVATVLLSLLPISSSDMSSSRNLRSDILAVIKFALEQVENLADFFLTFITDPSPCYQLLQEKRLIQVLDEEPQLYGTVVLSTLNQSKDELLATKIEATVVVLKEFRPMLAGRLFLEIACKSVQKWENDGDLCGLPRFVDHCNLEAADIVSQRTTSHFVAGVVFEQLKDYEIDYFDPEITGLLVNLVEAILSSTIRHLSARRERMSLDVVTENAHDLQLHSVISQNAKMAIGLAGAVVMTARLDERNKSAITQLCSSLSSFIANISKLKCDEEIFDTMVEDARKLLYVFGEDVRYPTPPPAPPKKESPTDLVESIRECLMDSSPVTRGVALLEAGRLIRFRHTVILGELDKWLFSAIKDLILDPDSYVYLAAINALAEAACYGSTYLREMITLFKNFNGTKATDAKIQAAYESSEDVASTVNTDVILRSRLCEVLGKVFRVLGDMSPIWMDESAGVFLSCLTDKDEIIRASALSSLAELILACRGRNIEKFLEEVLFVVERLLTTDTSALVRRSAVNLLRQIIKSCDTDIFEVVGGRLRDLQRELLRLWRRDSDHVVRLHAELALEELRAAVKAVISQETACPNRVVL